MIQYNFRKSKFNFSKVCTTWEIFRKSSTKAIIILPVHRLHVIKFNFKIENIKIPK